MDQAVSQVSEQWVARYDGADHLADRGNSLTTDASGNIYVTGTCTRLGNVDCITIKYNSNGVSQWTSFYSGQGNIYDEGRAVTVDASGNVYVAGYSAVLAQGNNYLTIKYNSSGVQQWIATYNGPFNDYDIARSIALDMSGNVYVTGESEDTSGFSIATVKYSSSGAEQWVRREWSAGHSDGKVNLDIYGNVYIDGYVTRTQTQEDYITIKYNSSGVKQWERLYNGTLNVQDFANAMTVDFSGNVYLTGGSGNVSNGLDYATVKYNSSGVQQWVATYNGSASNFDEANAITVDASGFVTVTGISRESGSNYDFTTVQYNSSGIQQWARSFNGSDNIADEGLSIKSDPSGNIYVTGNTNIGSGSYDFATIKYSPAGVQQWVIIYDGPDDSNNDIASELSLDTLGNIFVTGTSDSEINGPDVLTIKYSQTVGINQISSEIPSSYLLKQNYPNPFNPTTNLDFGISSARTGGELVFVSLKVYDILGNEIETLVSEYLSAGSYSFEWNASNYSSGVYLYKFETENFSDVKRMMLVK